MKKVGLIGGLSPESTITYYQGLNEGVQRRLGGHHSAKVVLSSVDFGACVALKEKGDWDGIADLLSIEAEALEKAGADFILMASNTMHKVADAIEAAINIPFLHLADATAGRILEQDIASVGLLGTRYTMELDFYKDRLIANGVSVSVPEQAQRDIVNAVIYDELCHGKVRNESRLAYQKIMRQLQSGGAQGIIMGCTEITLLIGAGDADVPLFDTTQIHIDQALEEIFS